ncbi:hypothetical protein GCM10010970_02460 [Silvimonas iriomotensis]|uniref:ER-bound oxygenase mpaB/mpaB'/Rubber oxygenase catalytic domain-containing protein n=1 Tax=Silvimonas iriomotensis TaxID=449662 RepID=A0ABQ2P4D8_9NEIS|nr:hypothetical protein GCM10010970_02460 [Silvimonas iriomotensis]
MQVWSNALLDEFKRTADPLADDCIRHLIAHGDIATANDVLARLDTDQTWPADTPAPLLAYLNATSSLPADVDMARIHRAQAFFTRFGLQFGVSLMCRSLPVLYAGKQGGAQVLAATGQLTNRFERRASETLRFILNSAEPGGLDAGGKGLLTIRKVRLMHAAIRHFALATRGWPQTAWPEQWGMPINQEELAGTMLAFSTIAVEGLRTLGVEVSKADEEDQLYLWKTIGHVLGIIPEAMPDDVGSARDFWQALDRRNFGPSPAGAKLAQAHVQFLQSQLPEIAHGLVPDLMAVLLGRRAAGYLGLQQSHWWSWAIDLMRWVFRIKRKLADSSHTAQSFVEMYSEVLMEALQKHWASADPGVPFRIPDTALHPVTRPAPASGPQVQIEIQS